MTAPDPAAPLADRSRPLNIRGLTAGAYGTIDGVAAVLERSLDRLHSGGHQAPLWWRWTLLPPVLAVLNATAFLIVRPGVNDLWAARARASAAGHGVGLTYWFSWFGGGSTPGNYSVLTPYLSALLTPELLGALAAVAITPLCSVLLKDARFALAGVLMATAAAGINLWSGRIPFILGCAFAAATLLAVQAQRRAPAVALTLLTVFASPVAGAFLALAMAGTFIESKDHRRISAVTIASVVIGLGVVGLAFGSPGPEHFSYHLCGETIAALLLFLIARPPAHLRTVIYLSVVTALLLSLIPNGMGSNFARLAWFCLPVAVVATSGRRLRIALLATLPALAMGASGTVKDLRDASAPVSRTAYYTPLATELDRLPGLANYRVEIVTKGAHAAYDALLDHAMLARGWETQEDNALNKTLQNAALDATSYKIWLDNNSVGYVAVPAAKSQSSPEYDLVTGGDLAYLTRVWSGGDWALYRVSDPTPIVAPPQDVIEYTQSQLTIRVPCTCRFSVRVRWSKFLQADPVTGTATARVLDDGYGFTSITVTAPGEYVLHGSVTGLFH
jgi:hypothetical protein